MHRFETLDDVQASLQKLMQRDPPLVKVLPRQPGTKESRYAHLLAGDVTAAEMPPASTASANHRSGDGERLAQLEEEVAALRAELATLKDEWARFRRQFE